MTNRVPLRPLLPLAALALLAAFPAASFAQTAFGDQTLAVVTIGNGASALSFAGNQVTLRNYAKTGGAQLGSALLPLFLSTSSIEGQLQADGSDPRNLYVGGYSKTDGGQFGVSGATGTQVPRRVTRFDTRTGLAASTDLGPGDYSQRPILSAQVIGGSLLTAGDVATSSTNRGGVLAGTFNPGGMATLSQGASTRSTFLAKNLGGTVYYTAGGGDIYTGPNLTGSVFGSGGSGTNVVITGFLFTGADTLYYSAISAPMGGGGGLFRATRGTDGKFGTGARLYSGSSLISLATDGTRLFAATNDGGDGNNSLLSFDLNGGSVTTLATAGANRAFRGVEVVPEPASMLALGLGGLALLRRRKRA